MTKIQSGHSVSSRLELATQSSREAKSPASPVLKKLTFHIPHIPYYKYPHSHEMWCGYSKRKNPKRGFYNTPTQLERATHFLEKSLQSLLIPSPIVTPIERRFLSKHYPHPVKVLSVFGVLGSIGRCKGWWMLWAIVESIKLEKKQVWCNLVGARNLEGLSTLGRLGLEGLLLFMYPNYIFQWITYRLKGGGEVLRRGLWFPLR